MIYIEKIECVIKNVYNHLIMKDEKLKPAVHNSLIFQRHMQNKTGEDS
jgi:hypothetical protein